jgi:hypothetical protein
MLTLQDFNRQELYQNFFFYPKEAIEVLLSSKFDELMDAHATAYKILSLASLISYRKIKITDLIIF